METATTSLKRPYTDLMAKEIFVCVLYAACFAMPPGSAFFNFIIASLWLWRSQFSQTRRRLPGLQMNVEQQPAFEIIIDRYKELKSKRNKGVATLDDRVEFNKIKQTIAELSPEPKLSLAKYRPNWLLAAAVLVSIYYRSHLLFPDAMRQLFGEPIWKQFQ